MKKNYTISIPRARFWTVVLPLAIIIMLIGGAGGMFIIDRFVMPNIVGISNRGVIDVPDLGGMPWDDARQRLYDIGLRLMVSERVYSDSLEKGVILNQEPEPGVSVKKGRQVCVIVSDGSEVSEIPRIRNLTERVARRKMRDAGFTNVIVHKVYDERQDEDKAIGTVPPSGVRTSRELEISLRISKGPRPTHATVPNVVGEMLSEAKMQIEDNSLSVGKIDYRHGSGAREGSVISQSLSPGRSVPLDSPIDIVVAASQ